MPRPFTQFKIKSRFTRLVIKKYLGKVYGRQKMHAYLCIRDCGSETIVPHGNLKNNHTRSCGCIVLDRPNNTKHNGCGTPEYEAWCKMKARCTQKSYHAYHHYGGRGIRVCDEWIDSFEVFLKDMGHKPSEYHSLDRIDTNGNYEASNCRWATRSEQMKNRRPFKRVKN